MNAARVSGVSGVAARSASLAATPSGMAAWSPWKGMPVPRRMNAGTPKRLPLSASGFRYCVYGPGCAAAALPSVRASSGSGPAMTDSAMAASVTLRAMGPVLSSSQSSGAMPLMLTRPRVG